MTTGTAKRSALSWILVFVAAGAPGFALRLSGIHVEPPVAALVYGLGIVGGAFLLSWAAEAAQVDVSASLAIAVLALVAVLPEYTIEAVLAVLNKATRLCVLSRPEQPECSLILTKRADTAGTVCAVSLSTMQEAR